MSVVMDITFLADSGPLSQRSAHAEQYAQTKTNTYNPDPNLYRRRCPDPNARIQKFIHYMAIAAICDSGLSTFRRGVMMA